MCSVHCFAKSDSPFHYAYRVTKGCVYPFNLFDLCYSGSYASSLYQFVFALRMYSANQKIDASIIEKPVSFSKEQNICYSKTSLISLLRSWS